MEREPDWDALNELNFLLYHRVADPLNAALSAIALADLAKEDISNEAGQLIDEMDTSQSATPAESGTADWWQKRANTQIATVLNLFTAWSWLVQYKTGMEIPERAIRPFLLQTLLDWLTVHLQLVPPLQANEDIYIHANQETVQEAILLLHSVASTQGTGAKLVFEIAQSDVGFKVQYTRYRSGEPHTSLDDFLQSFGDHWRMQTIAFELKTARDFLKLNKCPLQLNDDGKKVEFYFKAARVGQPRRKQTKDTRVDMILAKPDEHQSQIVQRITSATISAQDPDMTQLAQTVSQDLAMPDTPTLSIHADTQASSGNHNKPTVENREFWFVPTHQKIENLSPQVKSGTKTEVNIPEHPIIQGGWHKPATQHKKQPASNGKHPPQNIEESKDDNSTPIVISVDLPAIEPPVDFQIYAGELPTKDNQERSDGQL